MTGKNQYTDLIAGAHKQRPKFTAWVFTLTESLDTARNRLIELQTQFNLETAQGEQLDAIGARVGVSRNVPTKIVNVFFALDDVDGIGLNLGIWRGEYDSEDGITRLDDSIYRQVIKTKIIINHWDGKNETLKRVIKQVLDNFGIESRAIDLNDLQTMHIALCITKSETPPIVWELITRRILDIVTAGVGVEITDNVPWFGFDYDTASVKGLDSAHWCPIEAMTV